MTAASDTYEQKLQSEISKSSAPTLFQVNGPTGLANWEDYCLDLTGSKVLGELANDALKLEGDGKVYAIDYVEEDYGIIYNKDLLTKAGYSADDIKDFDSLKKVADDIQARKAELGVEGAFTSADDQAATLEFLNWVVTDDEATKAIAEDMGLTMPFKSAKEVANPLAKIAKEYVDKGCEAVAWDFVHIPSEEWKKNLSSALVSYAAGGSWDDVKTAFVDGWASEKAASK